MMMMMGCKFSKIGGAEGAMFRRTTRFRPLLLQQIAAMRTWRLPARPAKDTPSKKSLLLEEKPSQSVAMAAVIGNTYGLKVRTKPKNRQNHVDALHVEGEDDDDDQRRMIGACPGSPSFRIFFEDAARDAHPEQIGKNEALDETDNVALSKERNVQKKVKIRERKMRRHIKSVMSEKRREAGQALKNLLNVKACTCYHPSPRSNTLPVAEKTTFD